MVAKEEIVRDLFKLSYSVLPLLGGSWVTGNVEIRWTTALHCSLACVLRGLDELSGQSSRNAR
jgi:hypothetical protein